MASTRPPVIAAICHYNMTDTLKPLLETILQQGYDAVYVLDDASTGMRIRELAQHFPSVHFIFGQQNKGAGGNRNRILTATSLSDDTLLHFLDADVTLVSQRTPDIIRRLYRDTPKKVVGGLIITEDGKQLIFNYGPHFSVYSAVGGVLAIHRHKLEQTSPEQAERFYRRFHYFLKAWPNTLEPPQERTTFWVAEGNFVIPLRWFRQAGGFDERLRYHEIQGLSQKLNKLGVAVIASPKIIVRHPNIVSDASKTKAARKAELQLVARYGLHLK